MLCMVFNVHNHVTYTNNKCSLTCHLRKQTPTIKLKVCVYTCKYVHQHRISTSPIPFEVHLLMLPSTAQFVWKTPTFKKLMKFKH